MPVHVEEMTSEVTVADGELPLTSAQVEKLVRLVMSRLVEREREAARSSEATRLRRQASAPFEPGE